MTTLHESQTQTQTQAEPPASDAGARLRVILLCEVYEGADDRFLAAYEDMRHRVSQVPGHLGDQLCRDIEDPSRWLITSEWENAAAFLDWVDGPEHLDMVRPMHGCVKDTRSMRFSVARETISESALHARAVRASAAPASAAPATPGAGPPAPKSHGGIVRHALTFTVRPGTERTVGEILAGYSPPAPRVDGLTRLRRTSLFLHGNRVVRAIEVEGDLGAALRHVAGQPEIRAVEEALNPYLEEERDFDRPESVRRFFANAALPAVYHLAAHHEGTEQIRRRAFRYPVRPGCGADLAAMLAACDEVTVESRANPIAAATVYLRGDTVIRMVDTHTAPEEEPARVLAVGHDRADPRILRLLDLGADGAGDIGDDLPDLLTRCDMVPITDRIAPVDS